jgi:hypothetical protein
MTFTSKSDNFNAYPIHRYLENEKSHIELAQQFNKGKDLVVLHKQSIEKFIGFLPKWKQLKGKIDNRQNNKGFKPSLKIVDNKTIKKEQYLYTPFQQETFNPKIIQDLLILSNKLEKKGSKVIFFELPTYLLEEYFNQDFLAEYKKGLKKLQSQFPLISVDRKLFNSSHYRNIDHMNNKGAYITTMEILNQLKRKLGKSSIE